MRIYDGDGFNSFSTLNRFGEAEVGGEAIWNAATDGRGQKPNERVKTPSAGGKFLRNVARHQVLI